MNQDFDSHELPLNHYAAKGFHKIPEEVLEDFLGNVESTVEFIYSKYRAQFLEVLRAREYRKEQYCSGSVPYFVDKHESHLKSFCIRDRGKLSINDRVKNRLEEDRRFTLSINPYDSESLEKAIKQSALHHDLDFCFDFSMEPTEVSFTDSTIQEYQKKIIAPALLVLMRNAKIYFRTNSIRADLLFDDASLKVDEVDFKNLINFNALRQVVLFASLFKFSDRSTLYRNIAMHLQVSDIRTWQEARIWKKLLMELESVLCLEPGRLLVDIVFDNLEACFQPQEILFELQDFADGIVLDDCRKLVQLEELFGTKNEFPLVDVKKQVLFQRLDHVHFFVEIAHKHGLHCLFQERWTAFKSNGLSEKVVIDRLNRLFCGLSNAGFDGCFLGDLKGLDSARIAFRRKSQLHRYTEGQLDVKSPNHWSDFVDFAGQLEVSEIGTCESKSILKNQLDVWIEVIRSLIDLSGEDSFAASKTCGVSYDELKVLRQNVTKIVASGIEPDKSFNDTLKFLKCKLPEQSKLPVSRKALFFFISSLDLPGISSSF